MADWKLRGDAPAYQQVIEQIQRQIATGHWHAGQPLPTVRDLARQLGLNPGTVARAYRELEREGCIVTRRGGGSFVADVPDVGPWLAARESRLARLAEQAVIEVLSLGYQPDEFVEVVKAQADRWRTPSPHNLPAAATGTIRFVGSHDLAVELLANQFRRRHPLLPFTIHIAGSVGGLIALMQGEADVAGCHLLDEASGEYNAPLARRLLAGHEAHLVTLAERWQGLIVQAGNPKGIHSLDDLTRADVTFINRQPGSGTRLLLDQRLRAQRLAADQIRGYDRVETTHLAIATAVAAGQADVGLGIHAAAHALGLEFVPLAKERYDLIVLAPTWDTLPLRHLIALLQDEVFRRAVAGLGGYDVTQTGQHFTISTQSPNEEHKP